MIESNTKDISLVLKEDKELLRNNYRNKVVLVTGHTGFKGTWLSIWLKELGAKVIGFSLKPNTKPSLFEESSLENKVVSIIGDIRDENQVFDVIDSYKPEYIFHLAAQPIVRLSYENPKMTYETNVMGLLNIFEAVRKNQSVRVFVNVTSDKCYENKGWTWGYRENDILGGHDPYSSSKACSEILTSTYRRSFFAKNDNSVAVATARAGNVIGGGDWAKDRIIPDCVRSLSLKQPIIIRNPHAIRPWQYVLESLSGYLWLGVLLHYNSRVYSSGWNFGPNEYDTLTVGELVEKTVQTWGTGKWKLDENVDDELHEANYLRLDSNKAYRLLKWQTIYNVNEAVTKTINWYKKFYETNVDVYNLCVQEIKDYIKKSIAKEALWSSYIDIKT